MTSKTFLRIVAYVVLTRLYLIDLYQAHSWWDWFTVVVDAGTALIIAADHATERLRAAREGKK